ncbi:MAG: capsid protein [Planctomycetota bacterium]
MADANPSRLGQANLSGDAKALFLKVFAGETLTTFERRVIMKSLLRFRQIANGKSAQFPAIYRAGSEYHTPGVEISGDAIPHNEVTIAVDALAISHVFLDNLDEAMNHYEVRGEYARLLGEALAYRWDRDQSRNVIRAARSPALFTGDQGGQSVTDADGDTSGSSLADSIILGKQKLEEADVPVEEDMVNVCLKPAQWYLLSQETTKVINRDVGGQADYANGKLTLIGGVNVRKANAFPWGVDDSSNTDIPEAYRVDMSNTVGVVFTEAAAATVQLLGMGLEEQYMVNRQGTLMVAKYAVGHGPLVPKCAVEIKTA